MIDDCRIRGNSAIDSSNAIGTVFQEFQPTFTAVERIIRKWGYPDVEIKCLEIFNKIRIDIRGGWMPVYTLNICKLVRQGCAPDVQPYLASFVC